MNDTEGRACLTDDDKSPIQEKLDELKTLLEDDSASTDSLKEATSALMESAQIIGEKIYEAAQAEAAAASASDTTEGGNNDGVVEAEVVDAEVVEDEEA